VLPKIDRISNNQSHTVSPDQSHYLDEKMLKNNKSAHQSQESSIRKSSSEEEKGGMSEIKASNRMEDLKKSYSIVEKQESK
jgi:hypothetical protein